MKSGDGVEFACRRRCDTADFTAHSDEMASSFIAAMTCIGRAQPRATCLPLVGVDGAEVDWRKMSRGHNHRSTLHRQPHFFIWRSREKRSTIRHKSAISKAPCDILSLEFATVRTNATNSKIYATPMSLLALILFTPWFAILV